MANETLQGVDVEGLPPRSHWLYMGACSIESKPFIEQRINVEQCKDVCNHCPVKDLCLRYAIANNEKYGIWGGLTRRERIQVAKENPHLLQGVPIEFRDHWLELEGRVKRHQTPDALKDRPRNPALDFEFDQGFLDLIDSISLA